MSQGTPLLAGRRGLVMGVANDHSIAWGMAKAAAAAGAEIAFTYQAENLLKRVRPLATSLSSDPILLPCDVSDEGQIAHVFEELGGRWGGLDFVIHAIAYSNKDQLKGPYMNTTLENFLQTMQISCYSFTSVARHAAPLLKEGGSLITLSYIGAERVMPNYNVMGVAKAALEASVRYLASDLGTQGVRVNAVSAGPMRTLAGSAIGEARQVYRYTREIAPLRRNVTLDQLGGTAVYLLSDLSGGVTGEVHYVDAGFHAVGMPLPGTAPAPTAT